MRIFIRLFEKRDVLYYAPRHPFVRLSVNVAFLENSSYTLHPIKLKLDIILDHDVEQHILFQGYSPPNINRVIPL